MRWDYPPLDINPVFPGLGEIIVIIIIIVNIIIVIVIIIIIIVVIIIIILHPSILLIKDSRSAQIIYFRYWLNSNILVLSEGIAIPQVIFPYVFMRFKLFFLNK